MAVFWKVAANTVEVQARLVWAVMVVFLAC